jgi:hypothetical protein
MAAIANDTRKRVLIFKQSAGTGFDAPRAFVLASTKPVNDVDFAMQFIGRVMRVASPVRDAFSRPQEIPAELNTAYVYLGNQQAQAGFEAAVQATTAVKNQLGRADRKAHDAPHGCGRRGVHQPPDVGCPLDIHAEDAWHNECTGGCAVCKR